MTETGRLGFGILFIEFWLLFDICDLEFIPNYSYRSFSCKQIPHDCILLKIKQFNFF